MRQNDLTFDFSYGSCNSFAQSKPMILLCFDLNHSSECQTWVIREIRFIKLWTRMFRFDGEYFQTAGTSEFSHRYTLGMANYNNYALTTGCSGSSSCFVKTELMNMETLEWSNGPDYPLASYVFPIFDNFYQILGVTFIFKGNLLLLNCGYWWCSLHHRRLWWFEFFQNDCWIQGRPMAKTW